MTHMRDINNEASNLTDKINKIILIYPEEIWTSLSKHNLYNYESLRRKGRKYVIIYFKIIWAIESIFRIY
jgi:hypothetical protein